MFFCERVNSTVRYDSDEGPFFATPQCCNLMGSSEGPIFFLAAYALPIMEYVDDGGRRSICRCCRDRHRQDWYAIWDSRLMLMT